MSENRRYRRGLLDGMADIVTDLWGEPVPEKAPVPQQTAPAPQATAEPVYAARPALPPFAELWKTADESIDWTEALASPTPTDGLTDPEKWTLYHTHAEKVLQGDTEAYLAVLRAANPMADLMPYVSALDVSTASADLLRSAFTVREDLLEGHGRAYLCGMAVRIARDLFAALPVTEVAVTARQGDKTLLTVAFTKSEMNRVRFSFIDPEEYAVQCGAVFHEE